MHHRGKGAARLQINSLFYFNAFSRHMGAFLPPPEAGLVEEKHCLDRDEVQKPCRRVGMERPASPYILSTSLLFGANLARNPHPARQFRRNVLRGSCFIVGNSRGIFPSPSAVVLIFLYYCVYRSLTTTSYETTTKPAFLERNRVQTHPRLQPPKSVCLNENT